MELISGLGKESPVWETDRINNLKREVLYIVKNDVTTPHKLTHLYLLPTLVFAITEDGKIHADTYAPFIGIHLTVREATKEESLTIKIGNF
ncbi:MAG: hypothetical protein BWY21_00994 [Parcubacteria group bacterium ADurb.Bin216]|nr:MAG: hypothetical protein BWY21_00994 [Parcubacteria group bacterium ADurb.Bin216]